MSNPSDDADALLEHPFDQYQRYQVAAELVAGLGLAKGTRVLEVGGAPGPFESFFPDADTFVVDMEGVHAGTFIIANGASLPLADRTVDVVITLDTLEHVFTADRPAFLSELRRVSADLVIVTAPFDTDGVRDAEEAVREFAGVRFDRKIATYQWLLEHLEQGLPDLEATAAAFAAEDWAVTTLPSGYLPRWLAGMLVDHELLASGVERREVLHALYNRRVSPLDCREPAYRHVVVASRARSESELRNVADRLLSPENSPPPVAIEALVATALKYRLDVAMRAGPLDRELDELRAARADLERQLVDRNAHLLDRDQRLTQLQAELAATRAEWIATRERMTALDRSRFFGLAHLARKVRNRLSSQGETRT